MGARSHSLQKSKTNELLFFFNSEKVTQYWTFRSLILKKNQNINFLKNKFYLMERLKDLSRKVILFIKVYLHMPCVTSFLKVSLSLVYYYYFLFIKYLPKAMLYFSLFLSFNLNSAPNFTDFEV